LIYKGSGVRETGLEIVVVQFPLFQISPGAFIFNVSMFFSIPCHSLTLPVIEGLLWDFGMRIAQS